MLICIGQRTEIHLECSCQFEQLLTDVQQNVLMDRVLQNYVPEYMKVYVEETGSELYLEGMANSQDTADKICKYFEEVVEQFNKELSQ